MEKRFLTLELEKGFREFLGFTFEMKKREKKKKDIYLYKEK